MPQEIDVAVRPDQQTVIPAGQPNATQVRVDVLALETIVIAANPNRSYLLITNQGPDDCFLRFGSGVSVDDLVLHKAGWWGTDGLPVVYTGLVTAIRAAGTTARVLVIEF